MVLPVVIRELRVRARMPSTAYTRVAAAGLLILVSVPVAWTLSRSGASLAGGRSLYQFVTTMLLVFSLFEGVRLSAGIISEERREGTLGLLFLTDLSAVDILLGKLAAAGLTSLQALLATLPAVAFAVLAGGVTGGEVARSGMALLTALALALAAGLWASARARESLGAILVAIALLLGGLAVLPLIDALIRVSTGAAFNLASGNFSLLSPAHALELSSAQSYAADPGRFWLSQILQVGTALLLVLAAGRRLRRTWRDEPATVPAGEKARRKPDATGAGTDRHPDAAVAASLGGRLNLRRWTRILVALALLPTLAHWLFLAVISQSGTGTAPNLAILSLVQLPAMLAALSGGLILAYLAVRSLAEARNGGELELLLTTPLGDQQIVAHLWSHFRRTVFALTAVSALSFTGQVLYLLFQHWLHGSSGTPTGGMLEMQVFVQGVGILLAWYGNTAMVRVGFWLGLKIRRPLVAVGWTFGLVYLAPPLVANLLVAPLMIFGAMGPSGYLLYQFVQVGGQLAIHLAWIRWARRRLSDSFRAAATGG